MTHHINHKQLAFILDIQPIEARAKMCVAWAKENHIDNTAYYSTKKTKAGKETDKKILVDIYPAAMLIEMLSRQLNLPDLVQAVEDIETGYLKRPAARKWILCDYPEKIIKNWDKPDKPLISIPTALASMLPAEQMEEIKMEWIKRFPGSRVK